MIIMDLGKPGIDRYEINIPNKTEKINIIFVIKKILFKTVPEQFLRKRNIQTGK